MSELNESQARIASTLDGMVVVDAGPGTGKTHTIVERYVNLITREPPGGGRPVGPRDVMMLTFTRNAAAEMEERVKRRLTEAGMTEEAKLVRVMTFDAFCLSVVMESPADAGKLFGIEENLTHSVRLIDNATLNRTYFTEVLQTFLDSRGEDYGDSAVVCSQIPGDLYSLINRLMARGIFPLRRGWFGGDDGRELTGRPAEVLQLLEGINEKGSRGGKAKTVSTLLKNPGDYCNPPVEEGSLELPHEALEAAADDDRTELLALVHDVYWEYIRRSMADDRLTFGINAMLAFSVMYGNERVRAMNSFRYVMIDEFQDTNASQLMMALMMLKEPNLCVVGDWKQGIYGFRYVSIENITEFESRTKALAKLLNDDVRRVPFRVPEPARLHLDENYRSSQLVVDTAFRSLYIAATGTDDVDKAYLDANVTWVDAVRGREIGPDTDVRYVRCASKEAEADAVVAAVRDYTTPGRYQVVRGKARRQMGYGDIAVLCRKKSACRTVVERLRAAGVPVYLQGDVEIMSTREGKLLLAWLRYVSNEWDPWGYVPILADLGYSMDECRSVSGDISLMPPEIKSQRGVLRAKRRRINDLITSVFDWYGLDNDITQAIVTVLSTAHRDSLLTISDLITMIEGDISSDKTAYRIDAELEENAVMVTTMHRAKGLEFPAVILPYIDEKTMPSAKGESSVLRFNPVAGVRCGRTVGRFEGYSKICRSWQTSIVNAAMRKDYDEERRLMFVALSRAEQYETVICGPKPSRFMTELSNQNYADIPEAGSPPEAGASREAPRPDVGGYVRRRRNLGVHSVMRFEGEMSQDGEPGDEVCGKGKEYGTAVHEEALLLEQGVPPSGKYPESAYITDRVLSRRLADGFLRSYAEVECTLPLGGCVLKGVIDLLLVFEDRVEVHDYKTDASDRYEPEYVLQLSVYARAAEGFYRGLPVRCFIDYVSRGRTMEFEPMTLEEISAKVSQRLPSA